MKDFSVSNRFREIYDGYCEGESEWCWLGAMDKADNIVGLCRDYPHSTVLEIGAGEGSILKRLSDLKFGDMLYALELSEKAFHMIRERKIESLVECKVFDGYALPYEDDTFDLAVLSHVLEHAEYPRKLLYEAARAATYVFVEVPLEDNFGLRRDFVFDELGHINSYSPKTIRRLAQTCGLEVLRQRVTNPSLRIYTHEYGGVGLLKYLVKEVMLRALPPVATLAWTYHSAMICRKNR